MLVLVLGCGSIGRRHIGNLKKLGADVLAFDPDKACAAWVRKHLRVPTADTLEAGLEAKPDATWVCSPPSSHARLAVSALGRRIPCFIEKPIAHTLKDGKAIAAAVRRTRVPAFVGYQLRCEPAVQALRQRILTRSWGRLHFIRAQVGQYLPDWRPRQDFRRGYTARQDLGGGILLDASHEIDLSLFLAGEAESVYCQAGKLGGFGLDVEDTASLVLSHKNGAVSEVHLDMVSRAPRRTLELSFERATVVLDWLAETLAVYSASSRTWRKTRLKTHYSEHYRIEARSFLAAVRRPPRTAGFLEADSALETLAVVEAAKKSAATRRRERIP
ncbi:MAG: Gfo/Idh/MocA family oxidoreductase [Elusimicrobiota bacterium]|jgi:predicted dehydrogenase